MSIRQRAEWGSEKTPQGKETPGCQRHERMSRKRVAGERSPGSRRSGMGVRVLDWEPFGHGGGIQFAVG